MDDRTGRDDPDDRQARYAAIAFGIYVAVSLLLLLFVFGADRWFMFDEWDFLVDRSATDVGDLFTPHYHHWTTLPILVYRGLWQLVGLHAYWPYQVPVVVAHLTAAVLLRVIMRRSGVGPWLATGAAGIFVLFGTGEQNILWGFQVTLVGSLAFGLGHLVLADHDGPVDRRDWFGLLAGLAALMCSGVGVTMVVVVGIAALVRRGWRIALLHTAPLAGVYLAWVALANPSVDSTRFYVRPSIGETVDFVWTGLAGTYHSIGHYRGVGLVLGVLMLVGLVVAWKPLSLDEFRRRAAAPLALLLGAVILLAIIAYGRSWVGGPADRNQHLVAALILPAVAVGADAVIRRAPWLTPVVVVLLLVGVPANIAQFGTDGVFTVRYFESRKALVLGLPRSPRAEDSPGWLHPDLGLQGGALTIGWLRQAVEDGDLPEPPPIKPALEAKMVVRLAIAQHADEPGVADDCELRGKPVVIKPEKGDVLRIETPVAISLAGIEVKGHAPMITYTPVAGPLLSVELDDLELRIAPAAGAEAFVWCQ